MNILLLASILEKPGIIIALVSAVIVIAVLVYFWVRISTKKQRFIKAFQALDRERNSIANIPVTYKLLKLEKIGQNNVVYAEVHREYKKTYDEIISVFSAEYRSDCNLAKRELNDKNYRRLSEILNNIDVKLAAHREKMTQLSDQIDAITKEEDEAKAQEAELKSKSRECYEKYQRNHHELDILQDEFKEFFHRIDDKFQTYEEYIQRGSYTDAKEVLMMIKDNLDEIDNQLSNAPKYTVLVTRYIPQKINEVIDKYNEMQEKGFPLYHILANSIISQLKENLSRVIGKLKSFQYVNIENDISEMETEISKLAKALENEKVARDEFDKRAEVAYDKAEYLERNYIKHIKETAEVKKVYETNEARAELDRKIKVEIQKLSVIRRSLDALNYGRQPYSLRIEKLKDLEAQVEVVEQCMDDSLGNLESMRDLSDYAYNLIEESKFTLKTLELEIRNTKLEKVIQNYVDEFNYGYTLIEKLSSIIARMPIDISKVQQLSGELAKLTDKLEKTASKQIIDAQYAEKLLMYANTFRPSYNDVARDISKAEIYFYDGKFTEAIAITKEALSRFPMPEYLERVEV